MPELQCQTETGTHAQRQGGRKRDRHAGSSSSPSCSCEYLCLLVSCICAYLPHMCIVGVAVHFRPLCEARLEEAASVYYCELFFKTAFKSANVSSRPTVVIIIATSRHVLALQCWDISSTCAFYIFYILKIVHICWVPPYAFHGHICTSALENPPGGSPKARI